MNTRVLIVGGGLAGLSLAHKLNVAGCEWQLLESRNRCGGRILTETIEGQGYDLGPSWFWPGQPRMDALIRAFGLERFEQVHQGDQIYQDETGAVHQGRGMASMQGAWRLQGGLGRLIDALADALPTERLHLNTVVTALQHNKNCVDVSVSSGVVFSADRVVLAIPPRVASGLAYSPALPEQSIQAARNIPTWMAGHAKALVTYSTPFWQQMGLSGDAGSRLGPLAEIHDASPHEGGPHALFGFVGTPAGHRRGNTEALKEAIRKQLGQLFGEQGANPDRVVIKDWAFDVHTATDLDQQALRHHPAYGRPAALHNLWQGRLLFGSTEMGGQFGGFLEGALEVADELSRM